MRDWDSATYGKTTLERRNGLFQAGTVVRLGDCNVFFHGIWDESAIGALSSLHYELAASIARLGDRHAEVGRLLDEAAGEGGQ